MASLTVVESTLFARLWPDYWSPEEYAEFIVFLANNPVSGDVIPGSGGCRKIRWMRPGMGKRGGVRVIYTLWSGKDELMLLTMYSKSVRDSIPASVLRRIVEELGK